ncbi:MAG TPA: penicillin acylase family protein [Chitinophagales bacterium]|nr:penicillin acylase family protein [Chitinophagales bacterium]
MFTGSTTRLKLLLAFLIVSITTATAQVNLQNVEIVRDKWGVPHIFGKTDAETTYGLAWATCEDDFSTVQKMLLAVKGRLAEVDGKGGAMLDFMSFISGAEDVVDTTYDKSFSPGYKKMVEAYAQGLNDYAAANAQEVLRGGLFPVTPKDIVAQYVLTNMLLTSVYIDIQKIFLGTIKNYETNLPSGSNAFALNSSRTKDGETYLAVNSHQPLEGLFSWYEAHLVSDEGLNILGGTFPGGMSIFHGTNENLGWACTLNHPDLSDVYKLQMNPKNHLQYWFDDHWETLQVRKKTVKVKLGAIRIPITKTFYWSKYGTTLKNKDGFYSVRFPANMDIRGCETLYHMNKAKSFSEWKGHMSQVAFPGVNFIYADKADTIFYVSNGQFAHRDPAYDWRKVLPGNTSKTLWQMPFSNFESIPQVLNPKSGYILNTNNSCFDVTGQGDNPNLQACNPTFGYGTEKNNRSIRGHYLIGQLPKYSYDEFKNVKYDCAFNDSFYDYGLDNARVMFNLDPKKYPDLADALKVINSWNKETNVENKEAALVITAMYHFVDIITGRGTQYETNYFEEAEYVKALRAAKKHLLKHFGSITVPLGTVQKHVRGNVELPIGGMPEVLAATITQPYKDGMRRTFVGESYIQLVRYSKDGPKIETVHAFGASAKPQSPHFTDQMQMFVDKKLKPMTLDRRAIYSGAETIYHPQQPHLAPSTAKASAQ